MSTKKVFKKGIVDELAEFLDWEESTISDGLEEEYMMDEILDQIREAEQRAVDRSFDEYLKYVDIEAKWETKK